MITLISFGYLHDTPPRADRVEDVRDRLRDPAALSPELLDLDGHHQRIQDIVLNTRGARELLDNLVAYCQLPAGPSRVAIGCAGGKHRAPSLVNLLARRLRALGIDVDVQHKHIHKPRVLKPRT